jgi:ketosteroid isomerase-like protein
MDTMPKTLPLVLAAAALMALLAAGCSRDAAAPGASGNRATVDTYMEGFRRGDHAMVLACLTDDVEWDIPGAFHIAGKAEFDKNIISEGFVGRPTITVSRLTEEADVVVAEGAVSCAKKDGGTLHARFCDVFELRDGRIRKLTSYLTEVRE